MAAKQPENSVELTLTEQFAPADLELVATTSYDFGVARISVNGRVVADKVDCYREQPGVHTIRLGRANPVNSTFVIRCELLEPSPNTRGAKTYLGLDCLRVAAAAGAH